MLGGLEAMRRNSPSCPFQANTAGFREGSRPTPATMSRSFTRDWLKASGTANLSVPTSMLQLLVII